MVLVCGEGKRHGNRSWLGEGCGLVGWDAGPIENALWLLKV